MPMLAARSEDDLCALVFVEDVALPPTHAAHGKPMFLQMVGITRGENDAVTGWDTRGFLDLMRQRNPLLITDATRKTYLHDPDCVRAVSEGRERDGSSVAVLPGVSALWFETVEEPREIHLHLRTDVVAIVKRAMADRRTSSAADAWRPSASYLCHA